MSPEAQRIAIAEACGWTHIHVDNETLEGFPVLCGINPKIGVEQAVPDYLNDLDAMHDVIMREAEQKGFGFQADFQLKLQEVVERRRPHLNREQIGWWMNNATAAQRAEAFLRTKGLWKD